MVVFTHMNSITLHDKLDNQDILKRIQIEFQQDFVENMRNYIKDKNIIYYYSNCVRGPYRDKAEEYVIKVLEQDTKFIPYADKMLDKAFDMFVLDKSLEPDFKMQVNVVYENYHNDKKKILDNQLNLVKKYFDKDKLNLYFTQKESDYYDKESMQNIVDLCEEYSQSLVDYWGGFAPLDRIIEANQKADMLVEHIKSLNLSTFEQFLLVHDFVAGKPYKDDEKLLSMHKDFDCRAYVDCMTSDKIVCAGYAIIMNRLCDKLGIQCDYVHGQGKEQAQTPGVVSLGGGGHAFNMVHLVDPKYNINGCYLCDACWDNVFSERGSRSYLYAAMPLQDIQYDEHSEFFNEDMNIQDFSSDIVKYPDYSNPIPIETFEMALSTAYDKMNNSEYDKEFNKEFITRSLKSSIYHGRKIDDKQAENCFTQKNLEK